MIANIRVLTDGNSRSLCQLDLMKFSKEAVLARMEERGIKEDSFFICGFSDWEVDSIMSLQEAYLLKKVILELYDGDDFLVQHMLKHHQSPSFIMSHYYRFVSKDETALKKQLLEGADMDSVVEFFFQASSWVRAIQAYIDQGVVLNISKGFYVSCE